MKLAAILLASLTCASTASAQYFSQGWQPGESAPEETPAPTPEAVAPNAPPRARGLPSNPFDLTKILEAAPVASLFGKFGVNITKQLEEARLKTLNMWDSRILLITDDNYDEVIVNEKLLPEEEEKRAWFIVITAQTGQQSGMSKLLDDQWDEAFNITQNLKDIPYVKWGRIDYFNVTYLTTKWNIWQAPYVMVIQNRGQDLYFFQATNTKLNAEFLRDFLKQETWKNSVAWKTPLSPGGDYEKYMHYYAFAMTKAYNLFVVLPRWLVMILSGVVASLVMKLMHRNPAAEVSMTREEERQLKSKERREAAAAAAAKEKEGTEEKEEAKTSGATPSKGKAKSRKGGKK
ncbi:hypothetical protein QCA50_000919 [Cerrena zonata]|uniref:Uncharacterized protein n=1 Tax=Cerrena zonata TaxID=2478898 RepID=A0AAW0GUJ3_9APHY